MTNTTNLNTNDNTNSTKQEAISMEDVNKSSILNMITAELSHNGLSPALGLMTATAFIGAVDYLDDSELFMEFFLEGLNITTMRIVDTVTQQAIDHTVELDGEAIQAALIAGGYFTPELEIGTRLAELCELRQEAYLPPTAEEGVTRRFGYAPVKYSKLFEEAIHILESTEFSKSKFMESIALQVQAAMGGEDKDDEGYVLRGCAKLSETMAYVSEFKGDRRGRAYQASCHGPNGQSSDRSRALMDLFGVPTDYDVLDAKREILREIKDMTSDVSKSIKQLRELGDVKFIIQELGMGGAATCKKPWSFVKAANIMRELQAGNRPYIGMAVGLDAKCSGPQLGALMAGDQKIAAACGFTIEELDDAYALAIIELEKAGFVGLVRNDVKKPYMGIFYGQGYAAFTDIKQMTKDEMFKVMEVLDGGMGVITEDAAKRFHKAILSSFGTKMNSVRNLIKSYGKVTSGRTKHMMPDGFEVAMNYKVKINALGEEMTYDTNTYDVFTNNNAESYKFMNFQLNTKATHEGDFARNGFVNMIQATDALLARLIIVLNMLYLYMIALE